MKHRDELEATLRSIDGRGYKAYRRIGGAWDLDDFVLHVDYVQGDPYAPPTRVRVTLPTSTAGLAESSYRSVPRALGVAAHLARAFADEARSRAPSRGKGRGGEVRMERPGQEVLPQTAVQVAPDGSVEARFTVGLPGRGRSVRGHEAAALLGEVVPALVRDTLRAPEHAADVLELHAAVTEDQAELRARLPELGLVAFVGDGSVLPRRSGVDDRPLEGPGVVPFESPESLRVTVALRNAGDVTGMGVPPGVTLVVGGGFHGKSTLLDAVSAGVYDHAPGDGRERVVTVADAVEVRAEDGRAVASVDISDFLDGLPGGRDTVRFSTADASGSTSQAAAIAEALEAGASLLLLDEDTSATNFMIRDRRMQELVPTAAEPITPFVDRVRDLLADGVSTLMVLGGSGDYLDVADTVVAMLHYRAADVTERAHVVAEANPTGRRVETARPLGRRAPRRPTPGSVDPAKGRRDPWVAVPDTRTLLLGRNTVDLAAVEQLVAKPQVRAIGYAVALAARTLLDGERSVAHVLDALEEELRTRGLDALDSRRTGNLAGFRRYELAAALNRIRSLEVR